MATQPSDLQVTVGALWGRIGFLLTRPRRDLATRSQQGGRLSNSPLQQTAPRAAADQSETLRVLCLPDGNHLDLGTRRHA
jgi:hypothetical protein